MFLGDSITQLWGDDLGGNFPGVHVVNRGISGDTRMPSGHTFCDPSWQRLMPIEACAVPPTKSVVVAQAVGLAKDLFPAGHRGRVVYEASQHEVE